MIHSHTFTHTSLIHVLTNSAFASKAAENTPPSISMAVSMVTAGGLTVVSTDHSCRLPAVFPVSSFPPAQNTAPVGEGTNSNVLGFKFIGVRFMEGNS